MDLVTVCPSPYVERQNMNRLEEVLKLAATEPAHRPEFFQLLLAADVWVPGQITETQFAADTPVDLQHLGKRGWPQRYPIFYLAAGDERSH